MKCPDVRENLAAYLDGEIDGAPRRALDAHMAGCEPCSAERRAQAAAWRLLDLHEAPAVDGTDAAFAARVLERVRRDGGAPSGRLLRMPPPAWAAAAAAAVILVAGGLHFAGDGDEKDPAKGVDYETARTLEPPPGLLDDLAVLEAMDLLQDDDLRLLDRLADYDEEDLALLGG